MSRSHMASAVISGALAAYAFSMPPAQAAAFTAVTSGAALLPDMDHPGARLPRMLGGPGRMLAAIIAAVFGHRTLTHSVLGLGLLGTGLAFIPHLPGYLYAALILGCATHILGDMLTVSGVPIFWPHQRDFRLGRMRTGGQFETLVMTPLLIVLAVAASALVVVGHA